MMSFCSSFYIRLPFRNLPLAPEKPETTGPFRRRKSFYDHIPDFRDEFTPSFLGIGRRFHWFVDDHDDFSRTDLERMLGQYLPAPDDRNGNDGNTGHLGEGGNAFLKSLTSPSGLLVPSGKVTTDLPSLIFLAASPMLLTALA